MRLFLWHNPYDIDSLSTNLARINQSGYMVGSANQFGGILKRTKTNTTYEITLSLDTKKSCNKQVLNIGLWTVKKKSWTGKAVECDRDELIKKDNRRTVQSLKRILYLYLVSDVLFALTFAHKYIVFLKSGTWWLILLGLSAFIANVFTFIQSCVHLSWLEQVNQSSVL